MKLRNLFEVHTPRDVWKVAALLALLSMPFATMEKNAPWLFMLPVIIGALIVVMLNPNVLAVPKVSPTSPTNLDKNPVTSGNNFVGHNGSSNSNPPTAAGARASAFLTVTALRAAKVYLVHDSGTVTLGNEDGYRRAKSSTGKIVVNWTVEANHATKAGISTPAFGLSRHFSENDLLDERPSASMRSRFADEGIATTA